MHKKRRTELEERFRRAFAANLQEYRKRYELSQAEMAKKLHISVRSYNDLEHSISSPSATTLAHFMLVLEKEDQKAFLSFVKDALEKEE